jgi:hypothetical protein
MADTPSRDEGTDSGGVEQVHLPKIEADGIQAAAVEQCGKRSPQCPCGRDVEPAADGHDDRPGTDVIDTNIESSTARRRAPPARRRRLPFRHRASLGYPSRYPLLIG